MSHTKHSFLISNSRLIAFCIVLLTTTVALAQPGGGRGGRGGGDRGGGRGGSSSFFGGGRGGDSSDRMADFRRRMMERMDQNGNGKLEENEVSDRARGFLEGMVRQSGKSLKFPLSISDVAGGSSSGGRDRGGRSRGRDDDKRKKDDKDEEFEYPLVKGFGEDTNYTSFGVDPNLLNGRSVDIERMFDDSVLSTLDRTMERYDKDKNGVLEYEEWQGIPWQSDPRESDLDNDGRLTRAEMAERYRTRNSSSSRSRNSRSSERSRGGDDRGRSGSPFGSSFFGGFSRGGDSGRGGRGGGDSGRGGRGGDSGRGGRGGGDSGRGGRGGPSGFNPASMLQRFDQDGDGSIDFSKMSEGVKRFLSSRGVNTTGKVKITDIAKQMSGGSSGRSRSGQQQQKQETPTSKLIEGADSYDGQYSFRKEAKRPKGTPRWWDDKDENADGQVTMGEYMNSRSRKERDYRDFQKFDLNGDGIITPSEAEAVDD